ncbi:MAG: hypothetical protein HGA80_08990 [Candidatus Omnitrophica bacterium]|nr:hypothetical protein [Candidatus Omnitrophota bacterium]
MNHWVDCLGCFIGIFMMFSCKWLAKEIIWQQNKLFGLKLNQSCTGYTAFVVFTVGFLILTLNAFMVFGVTKLHA